MLTIQEQMLWVRHAELGFVVLPVLDWRRRQVYRLVYGFDGFRRRWDDRGMHVKHEVVERLEAVAACMTIRIV